MKLVSIEPTPSPHTMKLNLDRRLPGDKGVTYTADNREEAPELLRRILEVPGVRSVFQVADFIAVDRHPKADWREILAAIKGIFGLEGETGGAAPVQTGKGYGEVQVYVQMFRGIPMQIKLVAGVEEREERRYALPERFMKAAMKAQAAAENIVLERRWEERGVRYGDMDEIGETVAQEIDAAYDEERLNRLVEGALQGEDVQRMEAEEKLSSAEVARGLEASDWKKRFAALERMDPTMEDLPVLAKALEDPKASIRRLATVYLGMIGGKQVLPLLYRALKDSSAIVRRTAGDTLSDLGDSDAIGPMAEALKDPNKLVRWRAARFLYEVGDERALPALRAAQDDPEFEVDMQIKMAIARIESGDEASGIVWQQMTRSISGREKGKD